MKEILTEIAKKHLNLETLESRNSDELDFKEQAVWSIEEALRAAFVEGQKASNLLILKFQGQDFWSRDSYKDQYGRNYAGVDGIIHSVTADDEPTAPITKKLYFIED